jgi:hypothetical protein
MLKRLVVSAAAAAALVVVPAAHAAVTASNVTLPADGAGFDFDENNPGTITVSGTATAGAPGTDKVDIVCTYAENGGSAAVLTPLATNVPLTPTADPNTGTFTAQVSPAGFDYYTCRLRAVPHGGTSDYTAFTGPVVHGHGHQLYPVDAGHPNDLFDYYQDVAGTLGYWDGDSSSDCFLDASYDLDPASLGYAGLFGCANVGTQSDGGDPADGRSGVQVDGANAFLPFMAEAVTTDGFVPITDFTRTVDPASGNASLSGTEHLMGCANGSQVFPAHSGSCPSWGDSGVQDRATTVGDHGGRLVRHTDAWTNTTAVAHQLDVWYSVNASTEGFEFPGESAYALHGDGDHSGAGGTIPTPPAGASSVLVATDPAQDDYQDPHGSVTWSGPPSEIEFADGGVMFLHYQRTIPAGGSAAITLAFATDVSAANVASLSADAQAAMPKPAIAFASPASGATVNASTVTVTGAATGDGPLAVSVNGHPASVAGNGAWSVAVPLSQGANTLTATVSDADGNAASAQRAVTVVFPKGHPPTTPSNAFTFTVKKLKKGAKTVTVTLKLPGAGKVRAKLAYRKTTLAHASKSKKAKGTLTIKLKLSKTALKLIRKHHKLTSKLSLTFTPTGGTSKTKTKRLTLRS